MRAGRLTVRRALAWYLGLFVGLWMVALGLVWIQGVVLHKAWPYNHVFFIPGVRFSDFTIYYDRFQFFRQGEIFFNRPGFPAVYPAPLLICFAAYCKAFVHPLRFYLGTVILAGAFAGYLLWRHSGNGKLGLWAKAAIVATSAGCFPLLFLLDRANLEGLVWICCAAGIWAFGRKWFYCAGGLLALATAMKIFPGVLLLLLLAKRRYRAFVVSISLVAVITLGGLAFVGPSIPSAARGVFAGMRFNTETEALRYIHPEIGFEHSLLSCVKQVVHIFVREPADFNRVAQMVLVPYVVLLLLVFGMVYWQRLRKLPVLNQLCALSACSVLLPQLSFDYTLVHALIPWGAFLLFLLSDVAFGRVRITLRQALAFLIPYAVLFAPQSFLIFRSVGFGGQVKALALVAIVVAALRNPLPSSLFGDLDSSSHAHTVRHLPLGRARQTEAPELEVETAHSLS